MPAAGKSALYRPPPRDFDALFVRVGWTSIEAETRAHAKTIAKWLRLRNAARHAEGRPSLQKARSAWLRINGRAIGAKALAESVEHRAG